MDWQKLRETIRADTDYPPRCHDIAWHLRVIDGTIYDAISNPFTEERNAAGEYIPLTNRRPSVRSNYCRTVIDQAVSLLFSEGHFPQVDHEDEATRKALAALIKQTRLNERMIAAATRGAAGSVVVMLRCLPAEEHSSDHLPQFLVMDTPYLTPEFDPADPCVLVKLTERYKVRADQLKAAGYTVEDGAEYWFQRVWDLAAETWFLPLKVVDAKDGKEPQIDTAKTVTHNLGLLPAVWVRNLPGGIDPDGAPTAPVAAICTMIEIDYLLSQAGRGLRYASDPTLVITKGPPGGDSQPEKIGGAASALIVDGDAKLLEITGGAVAAVLEHVRYLRAMLIEAAHGNRVDADKLSAAQSGRAMELMNQALVWLADRLRISYGEGALLSLLQMACRVSAKLPLLIDGKVVKDWDPAGVSLKWPPWYSPTPSDRMETANELSVLVQRGLISRETAVKSLMALFDIDDFKAEMALIAAGEAAQDARTVALAAQVKATETVNG